MQAIAESVDALNSLLRGEIAATETYVQALTKMQRDPASTELRRLRDDHREAANAFRRQVHQHGGEPQSHSGVWGAWAKLVEGGARLLGNTAALKALKEGEQHGLKSYERELADESLPIETRTYIRSALLPQTGEHIAALDRMLNL